MEGSDVIEGMKHNNSQIEGSVAAIGNVGQRVKDDYLNQIIFTDLCIYYWFMYLFIGLFIYLFVSQPWLDN